jgi:hypothetical protein
MLNSTVITTTVPVPQLGGLGPPQQLLFLLVGMSQPADMQHMATNLTPLLHPSQLSQQPPHYI